MAINNNKNEITTKTTKEAPAPANVTSSEVDFLKEIRIVVKDKKFQDAYAEALKYMSETEGALTWLVRAKTTYNDHIVVTKNFNFNPSDMIGDIIRNRCEALKYVAYNVNLEDILQVLESTAWCCGISK